MTDIAEKCFKEWQRSVRKLFPVWQSLGIHVVPNHFYQPIPDTRLLTDEVWEKRSQLVGIDMREESQLELLDLFKSKFKSEYEAIPRHDTGVEQEFYIDNNTFASVDAEIFYSMIRHCQPKSVCEIGSGFSTLLAARALLKNAEMHGIESTLTAIEPYPNEFLSKGFPGLTRLVKEQVQRVPLSEFTSLGENDILFIDSSHVVKVGSDVQYEYLEILPRLPRGVIVHIHDIFIPAEYPRDWILKEQRFWNEQYLLQAFLTFNDTYEVLWAGSFMHLNHPDRLESAFSSYSRESVWPGSFWIRRIK